MSNNFDDRNLKKNISTYRNKSKIVKFSTFLHCLSAFAPTKLLYKYLLKYVSDNGQQVINNFD